MTPPTLKRLRSWKFPASIIGTGLAFMVVIPMYPVLGYLTGCVAGASLYYVVVSDPKMG